MSSLPSKPVTNGCNIVAHTPSFADPWAGGQLFAQIENPHPTIAFAVVGPIDPWHATRPKETPVCCLLIGTDGMSAYSVREKRGEQSLHDFWSKLSVQLDLRQQAAALASDKHQLGQTPMMALTHCKQLANWIPASGDPLPSFLRRRFLSTPQSGSEINESRDRELAFKQASQELGVAIDTAFTFLDDEFSQTLFLRPTLRFDSAATLIRYARASGAQAVAYMYQALKTECLGLINAAVEEIHAGYEPCLADVICKGQSLPHALLAYGVPHWLHRRTLTNQVLNSEDCDGHLWLAAVKTIARYRDGLDSEVDCEHLALSVRFVQIHVDASISAIETLLRNTLSCLGRTEALLSRYNKACAAICKRIAKVTGRRSASTDVLRWLVSQPIKNVLEGTIAELLPFADAHFLRLPIQKALNAAFREQPEMPETYRPRGNYTVVRLEDLDTILSVGERFGNCLGELTTIMDYVHFGFMFYAIKDKGRVLAIFTLEAEPDHSESTLLVKVQQLEAGASKDHCEAVMHRDAWDLAVCLCTPESTETIRRYLAATRVIRARFD